MTLKATKRPECPLCSSSAFEQLQHIESELAELTASIKDSQRLRKLGIRQASAIIDRIQELRQERAELISKL